MKNTASMCATLSLIFFACAPCRSSNDNPPSPEALIARARLEEVWADGTPPISLRAAVQVTDANGTLFPGNYTLDWVSPAQWREDIQFNGYERLRVGKANGYWQSSSLDYQPKPIFQLSALLHVDTVLKIRPKQTMGKVHSHEKAALSQMCTDVINAKSTSRVMCFDESNGTLTSVEYHSYDSNAPDVSRIEYSKFNLVGGKFVPYQVRAFEDRKLVASVDILEIKTVSDLKSAPFPAPTNAQFWDQCDNMQEPELIKRIEPNYPSAARANHISGRVFLYAVIEADGTVSHLTFIRRANPDLDDAAMAALRQWQYKPAMCGQTPIRVETLLQTIYALQGM